LRELSILLIASSCSLAGTSACIAPVDETSAAEAIGQLHPTLESIQAHILTPSCAGCHNPTDAGGGLDLSSADASYAGLVEIPAKNRIAAENHWLRVKPGDPELSFLFRKIGAPGVGEGAPMPVGEYELSGECLDVISTWIRDGASR
jgi:hypothetical protein